MMSCVRRRPRPAATGEDLASVRSGLISNSVYARRHPNAVAFVEISSTPGVWSPRACKFRLQHHAGILRRLARQTAAVLMRLKQASDARDVIVPPETVPALPRTPGSAVARHRCRPAVVCRRSEWLGLAHEGACQPRAGSLRCPMREADQIRGRDQLLVRPAQLNPCCDSGEMPAAIKLRMHGLHDLRADGSSRPGASAEIIDIAAAADIPFARPGRVDIER